MARIAVIAVHGVADQKPNDTARSIAMQLQSIVHGSVVPGEPAATGDAPSGDYSAISESPVIIPVRPVRVRHSDLDRADTATVARWRQALRNGLYSSYAAKHLDRDGTRQDVGIDYKFTLNQLASYTGRDDAPSYDTVMLSTTRRDTKSTAAQIDIYEMYWADMSRLGKGLLRILGEFYQLLFHIGSLGKTTVDLARIARNDAGILPALAFFQSISSWLLALPIALLNLYLVLIAGGLFLVKIPPELEQAALLTGVGAIAAMIAARLAYERWQFTFGKWATAPIAGFLLGAVVASLLIRWTSANSAWLTLIWVGMVLLLADAIAAKYEKLRPGARIVSRISGLAILIVLFLSAFFLRSAESTSLEAPFLLGRLVEFVFLVLVVSWAVLAASHLITWALGRIAIFQAPASGTSGGGMCDPRSQIERTVWTGCLGMFVPAALFLLLTLSLWSALVPLITGVLGDLEYEPLCKWLPNQGKASTFVTALMERSAGTAFDLFFASTLVTLLLLLWGFAPSLVAEMAPPRAPLGTTSRKIGYWLDHGIDLARWAGRLMLVATFVVLPVGVLATACGALNANSAALKLIGVLLAGSAVGLVGLGSRFGKVFLGMRGGLDVALDVDNWLRERPLDSNVRSRICARYVSLLRHICSFRDPHGKPYDAIVIVAHSQGTVITADLLRFLAKSPDPQLADLNATLPIYLFTVGCPLRQLYGRRFPHLYEWATHVDGIGQNHDSSQSGLIPADQRPLPADLRVKLWVNAFRSGDYVGRSLWLRDDFRDRWKAAQHNGHFIATDEANGAGMGATNRVEFCIGAGAHTHYFDQNAGPVAQTLDQLIGIAIVGKQNYPYRFPHLRCRSPSRN